MTIWQQHYLIQTMNIKARLKEIPLIYKLNAKFKAARTRYLLGWLIKEYAKRATAMALSYDALAIPEMVRQRLQNRGLCPMRYPKGELEILWVGANREQDYSGFVQGLELFGRVHVFTRHNDNYGQEFSRDGKFDAYVAARNGARLIEQVDKIITRNRRLDLVIGQMWADYLPVEALQHVQQKGVVTACIAMDDRLPDFWLPKNGKMLGVAGLVAGLDLVLTSAPECTIRYLVHGCPAIFWPMASDPGLFRPAAVKDIDVCFVGNKYGIRGQIIDALKNKGIHVEAYGSGWANGPIGPDKAASVFGRSKIILGVGTIAYNEDVYTLKLRDFDATMAGALYITHRNPDLLEFFQEGKEIECYTTEEEAVSKISYYLRHPDEMQRIGGAAAIKARMFHNWETRIGEALHVMGLEPI
ncbi:MAG: CgeB family protein [Pseudomonadota bacterium]